MSQGFGKMLSRFADSGTWKPRRQAVLTLRIEGVESLVARLGPDEADLVCQRVRDRVEAGLGADECVLSQDGPILHLAVCAEGEREMLIHAGSLRRSAEAPLASQGRRVSLRVTGVLAQSAVRQREDLSRLAGAGIDYLDGLAASRAGALWAVDVPPAGTTARARLQAALAEGLSRLRHPPAPRPTQASGDTPAGVGSSELLADAVARGAVETWLLPVYCCASGHPLGVELRPRWRHPRLGLSSTTSFRAGLDAAARLDLARLLIASGAAALANMTAAGHPRATLALRLEATDLAEPNLAEILLWEADRADVAPERFEIVCDETALPPGQLSGPTARASSGNLARLHDAGVTLTLAEFGTGALMPDQISGFGMSGVLLDRTLIRGIGSHEVQPLLVSLLALAKREGLAVTADGVASSESLALLSRLGCDRARGPGLGRTVPLVEAPAALCKAIPLWDVLPPLFRVRRP